MLRQVLLVSLLLTTSPALAQANSVPVTPPAYQQALDAIQEGRYAEAVSLLEQYTRLNPEDLKALQALAAAYLELKSLELAEVTLKSAHALERNDPQTHFLRGRLRSLQQDYTRALSEFRTVLYLKQSTGELYYQLADTYSQLQQPKEAQEALLLGLSRSDNTTSTQARLLLLKARLQPEQAESAYNQALALKGLEPALEAQILTQLAQLLVQNGRSQELITRQLARLEKAFDQNQADLGPKLLIELDNWLAQSPTPEQDRIFLKLQLEALYDKHPAQPLLRQQLIRLYHRYGLYEELLAFYQTELITKGSKMNDLELARTFHLIADVNLKLGYVQFAYNNYKRATDKNPHDTEALKRQGIIFLTARDPGEAVKIFTNIQKELPLDQENLLLLSLALAYKKQDDQARKLLAQVPAEVFPEIRVRVEAALASAQRQIPDAIWKELIPEDKILSES